MSGWVVLFLLGCATELDARSGTAYRAQLRAAIDQHSPVLSLELSIHELDQMMGAIRAALPEIKEKE